jgi:cysteinyl-tRNA synthetase
MDFTWEAMTVSDARVKQLRRHMATWAPRADALGDAAEAYERRFRDALANDLHMPGVVAIVNELDHAADVPDAEKYRLLASWDEVLGLDLEHEATSGWQPTPQMRSLIAERDAARERKDYATSDRIRDELTAMGLEVMDTPGGTSARPHD